MDNNARFLEKFSREWRGGYFEGNPQDSMAVSSYGIYGYNSILYTIYSACIRPYVTPTTTILEIGPGRGAWTRAFLDRGCQKIYAVDAAPAEHTNFWQYVGRDPRAEYIMAHDFKLSEVPDGSIDLFFSFGVFCHLTPEMCEQYIASLTPKMRVGSRGFLMIADFDKYNRCLANAERLSIKRIFEDQERKIWRPFRLAYSFAWRHLRSKMDLQPLSKARRQNIGGSEDTGWYHWGVERACEALQLAGLEVVESDIEVNPRDPMIHFVRR